MRRNRLCGDIWEGVSEGVSEGGSERRYEGLR